MASKCDEPPNDLRLSAVLRSLRKALALDAADKSCWTKAACYWRRGCYRRLKASTPHFALIMTAFRGGPAVRAGVRTHTGPPGYLSGIGWPAGTGTAVTLFFGLPSMSLSEYTR